MKIMDGIDNQRAAHTVLRYAKKTGWNIRELPEHGACLDVLARIIAFVERKGMRLGRWRHSFDAVYAVFIGSRRPRSCSKHGFGRWHTRGNGGITVHSDVYRRLLAYEDYLKELTDSDWADARKEASELVKPVKRKNGDPRSTKAAASPVAVTKPCLALDYCPYGVLVEGFPLSQSGDRNGCDRYGHLCPAFVVAESVKAVNRLDGEAI